MNDNKKLLLIENDLADQANSLCLFLKGQNGPYIVTCVTSLIEAEKYLSSQYFDLILLEHRLIKDRIHTLSDVFRQIPVILITDEDDVDVIEMMKQGADDVLRRDHEGKYRKYLPVVIQKSLARQQLMAKRMDKLQSHVSGEGILLRRLTDTLAHDLSNVISPLLGFSKIILDETEQNDPHFELLHEIHSSALRAKNMVRQLSIFREKDASSFKLINLG